MLGHLALRWLTAQLRPTAVRSLPLRVQLDVRADVTSLRHRIETDAVARARQALDDPRLPVQLDLVVTSRNAAHVS